MAVGSPPTVRRRQLGRELRRLREESGMLAEQLADRLRCSPSRISRIETARIRITPGTVHEILDALRIHGPDRDRLVALARQAEEPGWWQPYTDALTYEYSTYIALESEAVSLKVFEPILVYGLLQTEDYARAVVQRAVPQESEVRIAARLARQALLTKQDPPDLHVVLDESVLHHVLGSQDILRAQLRHLVEAAQLPNVTIQVLAFSSADVLKFLTGPVVVMEFDHEDGGPVIYLESLAGDLYVEKADVVEQYVSVYDKLRAVALDPDRTVKLLKRLAR